MNARDSFWELKIAALLHDPLIKPFIMILGKEKHAVVAEDIAKEIGVANLKARDAGLGWLIAHHHSPDPKEEPEEYQRWFKVKEKLPLLKMILEADHNSSAADRIPVEDIQIREILTIHPLSGERLQSLKMLNIDYSEIKQGIINFFSEKLKEHGKLKERFLEDPKLLYLTLWRFLPHALIRAMKNLFPNFVITNLPADTRIPTHTIWDHVRTASALVTCFSEKGKLKVCFLRFELGDVQSFLSKARTTADYWAGSWIASTLMFSIIKEVSNKIGPDSIIYPDVHEMPLMDLWLCRGVKIGIEKPEDESILTPVIPEAVLVIAPQEETSSLRDMCEYALNEAWKILSRETRRRLKDLFGARIQDWDEFDETWNRQTEELPFTFRITKMDWPGNINEAYSWLDKMRRLEEKGASVLTNDVKIFLEETWEASERKGKGYVKLALLYGGLYEELQAKMYASRIIRHFEIRVDPGGLKKRCNLCGLRNPVWHPNDLNFWGPLERERLVDFNERLCSICLIKRILGGTGSSEVKSMSKGVIEKFLGYLCDEKIRLKLTQTYPSTSDISTAAFKRSLLILWERIRDHRVNKKQVGRKLKDLLRDFLIAWENYMEKVYECLEGEKRNFKDRRTPIPLLERELTKVRRDKEILKQLISLMGEYLFEETYEREFRRIKEMLFKMKGEAKKQELQEKLNDLKESISEVKKNLENFLSSYNDAVEELKEKRELKGRAILKPNDTFVLLIMDGDSIGKWISGANNPVVKESVHEEMLDKLSEEILRIRRAQSPANHAFISRALSTFALKVVRRIIEEENCGKIVYSGGDDVMALLPPEDAFKIAMRLREEYSKEWGLIPTDKKGMSLVVLGMGHRATSSIALACAHYMYHLDRVIDASRNILRETKNYKRNWEKDAICAVLYSRAGEIAGAGPLHLLYPNPREYPVFVSERSWRGVSALRNMNRISWLISSKGARKGHTSPLVDALELSQLIKGKEEKYRISRRILYELIDELELFEGMRIGAIRAELRRLIRRHISIDEKVKNKKVMRVRLVNRLTDVLIYWYNEGCLEGVVMLAKVMDSLLGDVIYG